MTVRPGAVADTIERHILTVAERLRIQEHSVWRYLDPADLADSIAEQWHTAENSSAPGQVRGDRGL
ncbi:hypothetical protein AQF52_0127 [Streptomyces venezuelae]|uniref:hypothetical protein n=1 Tax=Streptomyces gardneri TaxID=66892 RepID=UPI0006BD8371|nr:hypothetical protein [Streptomyces gardneri]ALO05729.1 hypothetical protein AQF52_0127 [Streptomyces venezuelae]QPK43301.1 hypothetical protein H4W23_00630 [Streptomyces gardneri]WRK34523.1 hypothetical protein U0M97_00625 [Streptomyces venezuelae]CUM44084.1 hypothetical protein BN2537_17133 [Streptomyces venezuelae]